MAENRGAIKRPSNEHAAVDIPVKKKNGEPRIVKVLMLGLNGAGKTTILSHLTESSYPPGPTIGFNVDYITRRDVKLDIWDLGGDCQQRPMWKGYFPGTDAVIFVADWADWKRFKDVESELQQLLDAPELKDAIFLNFANKMDIAEAPEDEEYRPIEVERKDQPWHIEPCIATTGKGIYEGIDWIIDSLKT